ncbi:MAG: sulfite exporter TauE/SafE family protein [Planctomycetaceae bacterium]|nr:sulfite exporter TauE/SafE family protein [Planctomycetaceae bacterium]
MSDINFIIIVIIAGAGFVRGAVGFGDALFAMPLLALVATTQFSSALMALCALLMALILLVREWKHLEFQAAVTLIACGFLGIPIGHQLLKLGNESVVKAILGVAVMLFSLWSLFRPSVVELKTNRPAPIFGFLSGILGGAYNIAGPPLVIFGTLRKWSAQQLRSVMQAYCIAGSIVIVTLKALDGAVTLLVLRHFAFAIPVLAAATLIGQRLTRDMPTERFARWVHVCLLISSLTLLYSCLPAQS